MFMSSRIDICSWSHPQYWSGHYLAKMHINTLALFSAVILISICKISSANLTGKERQIELQCIEYYQTGNDFVLETLVGKWYAVYMWPVRSQQRDRCVEMTFKKLSSQEIKNTLSGCEIDVTEETFVQGSYRNVLGKPTSVTYYGDEEVKRLFRACDHILNYIFIQINKNYVLGVNCSSQGRGILLSKFLPTREQVDSVVASIEIMRGREGSPDCNLA